MRDPYEVLELKPGATDDEIKAAYRRLAQEISPRSERRFRRGGGQDEGGQRGLLHPYQAQGQLSERQLRLDRRVRFRRRVWFLRRH